MNYGPIPFSVSRLTAIPVSQHGQSQSPGQPKWNRAIMNVINYTCVYPGTGCTNGCSEKGLLENKNEGLTAYFNVLTFIFFLQQYLSLQIAGFPFVIFELCNK